MSIFTHLKGAPRPLGSADAGAALAERQEYAGQEAAAAEAAHDAYRAALSEAALAGIALDTPAVEKAQREYERARERADRAREACEAAQAQHDAAVAREHEAAEAARWDKIENLVAKREKAALAYGASIAEAAALQTAFQQANVALFRAIPLTAPAWVRDVISKGLALATLEVRRVGLTPLYAGESLSALRPFAEVISETRTLFEHLRKRTGPFAPKIEQPQPVEDDA